MTMVIPRTVTGSVSQVYAGRVESVNVTGAAGVATIHMQAPKWGGQPVGTRHHQWLGADNVEKVATKVEHNENISVSRPLFVSVLGAHRPPKITSNDLRRTILEFVRDHAVKNVCLTKP